jgi:hypothetical protein
MHSAHTAGVQELLRSNTAANAEAVMHAKGAVDVAELTWGQLQLPAGWEQPDVVLAADLVRLQLGYLKHDIQVIAIGHRLQPHSNVSDAAE